MKYLQKVLHHCWLLSRILAGLFRFGPEGQILTYKLAEFEKPIDPIHVATDLLLFRTFGQREVRSPVLNSDWALEACRPSSKTPPVASDLASGLRHGSSLLYHLHVGYIVQHNLSVTLADACDCCSGYCAGLDVLILQRI